MTGKIKMLVQQTVREEKKHLEPRRLLYHMECSLQNAVKVTHESPHPPTEACCMISPQKYYGVFNAEKVLN